MSGQASFEKPKLIALVGPTAVGKTKLSLELAEYWNAEIISGDSMQVYRGMDIGTAKATPEERARIPHHLIDICNPDRTFSAADFQQMAKEKIEEIHGRGRLPMVVGGTGLYVESLCYGYEFSDAVADEEYRKELNDFAGQYGPEALHKQLREIDPAAANKLHPNDVRRVIRALEIVKQTGVPKSEHQRVQRKESPYELCLIGLSMDRAKLYERIEQRVDLMLQEGLEKEVRILLESGYSEHLASMQGLGYKEMVGYIQGEYDLEQAVYLLKRNTRRFAKRQLSWFRHMEDLFWVDMTGTENFSAHFARINDIIAGKFRFRKEYNSEQT